MTIREKVIKIIDDYKDEFIDFLQRLVQIPSLPNQEKDAQIFVAEMLKSMGLYVDIWEPNIAELKKHPAYIKTPWGYEGRPNVVGILKGKGGGKSLILNGHIDVVSPEPLFLWKHNPWGAEIENDMLFGRGALDMKGGLVSMLYALKCIRELGIKLKGDVIFESVIEEECGGPGGTLSSILRGYKADAAIITEPTGLDSIWINSAGVLWFRVKVIGKSVHGGYAHLGVNAIGKALKIYEALISLDEYRAQKIHNPFVEKKKPGRSVHLNIGTIRGGDWPSTVAGWAELECRISFQYPERMSEVKHQVEDQVRKAAELDPWMREHLPVVEWFGYSADAATSNPEGPIFQTVTRIAKEIVGKEPEAFGTTVANDLRHFVLYANMPDTILYGPGGSGLHGIDECVSIDDCILLTKILALTIIDWCGYVEE